MDTTTWSKEEKTCEIGMIEMPNTVVYPRAMMIHLQYTSNTRMHNCTPIIASQYSNQYTVFHKNVQSLMQCYCAIMSHPVMHTSSKHSETSCSHEKCN